MRLSLRGTLAATTALFLGITAIASASSGQVSDPRGDTAGHPPGNDANSDLVRIKAEAGHGDLIVRVKVAGKLGDTNGTGFDGVYPEVFLKVPGHVGNSFCDYKFEPDAAGTPNNPTHAVRINVYKCKNKPTAPIGIADMDRVKPGTQKFVLSLHKIGNPGKVGFFAQTIGDSNQGIYVVDQASNNGSGSIHTG